MSTPARARPGGTRRSCTSRRSSPWPGSYLWDLPEPDWERIEARVDLTRGGRTLLEARLTLRPEPLTDRALAWALVRHPFMTLKVAAAIHFEALRLWRRGAPVFPNPSYDPVSARKEVA